MVYLLARGLKISHNTIMTTETDNQTEQQNVTIILPEDEQRKPPPNRVYVSVNGRQLEGSRSPLVYAGIIAVAVIAFVLIVTLVSILWAVGVIAVLGLVFFTAVRNLLRRGSTNTDIIKS